MRRVAPALLLVLLAATAAHAADDLAAVVKRLGDAEHNPRWQAYLELNRRKDPAVLPLLVAALPGYPDMGQYYGVQHMQQYPPKLTRGPLRRLATANSAHLRVLAAAALHRMGERDAAAIIVRALRAEHLDTAQRVRLLTRIYSLRDEGIQRTVRALVVPGADPLLLGQALYVLYLVRDAEALPTTRALLKDERPEVRSLGAAYLVALGETGGVDALAEALRAGETTSASFYKVKNMLQQVKPAPAAVLAAVLELVEESLDTNVQRAAIQMLGEHGYAKAAPALRKLLDHRNPMVSKAAFEALAGLPGGMDADSMRKLLAEGTDERRLAAADALRRADDKSGFPVVLEILTSGARYQDRAEAARVLGGFRTPKAVEPLLAALMDDQMTVRAGAYNGLGYVLRSLYPYRRLDLASTGYTTSASEAVRRQAVARIRAWWSEHRGADW